jgi:predicted TIM-barrel fold metal-dependent hydrolase
MSEGPSTDSLLLNGCDTHVHIIGPQDTYAMVQSRHYTPGPASVQQLKSHLANQGIGKAVIVQPSVYGTDNSCLLAAIADMGQQAKGIAVLDPQISASALQALDRQGIRGIRLNFESSGNQSVDQLKQALAEWAPKLEGLGWHIQVYAPFVVTTACAPFIQSLPVPVVLDHFGLWPANHIETPETRPMLRLFEAGHIFIKLSASYRLPAFDEEKLNQLAHHLLQVRPDRLLWASDWPHTNREPGVAAHSVSRYRNIQTNALVKERLSWLNNLSNQRQVLEENPNSLYRFSDS